MHNLSPGKIFRVIRIELVIVAVIYSIIGYSGYITFATDVSQIENGNILDANYGHNIPIAVVTQNF